MRAQLPGPRAAPGGRRTIEAAPDPSAHATPAHANPRLLLVLIVGAGVLYLLREVLLPFVLAAVPAYLCTPLIEALTERTGWPRAWFAGAALLVILTLSALLVALGSPALAREATRIAGDLQGSVTGFLQALIGVHGIHFLGRAIEAPQLSAALIDGARHWLADGSHVSMLLAWSFAATTGFVLAWVLLGYFLFDGPRIAQGLLWLVPPARRAFARRVWQLLDPLLRRYFVGVALVIVYASVVAYLGLGLILGLHHAFLLALLTGVLELVPMVGPIAGAVIAGLVATQEANSAWSILAYVLYAAALRLSIDQFFGPLVLGRAALMRPVGVIFAFLCGAVLFGVVGVILAIPAALTIRAALTVLYESPSAHAAPTRAASEDREARS